MVRLRVKMKCKVLAWDGVNHGSAHNGSVFATQGSSLSSPQANREYLRTKVKSHVPRLFTSVVVPAQRNKIQRPGRFFSRSGERCGGVAVSATRVKAAARVPACASKLLPRSSAVGGTLCR